MTDEAREAAMVEFANTHRGDPAVQAAAFRAGWAARSVSPLAVDAVARVLCRWHEDEPGDVPFPCAACKGAAGAIVAEFGPLTAKREAIARTLYEQFTSNRIAGWDDITDELDEPRSAWLAAADAVMAVADRAEVEREAAAKALEDAAHAYPAMLRDMVSRGSVRDWLRARAAEIREGGGQ